GRTVGGHRSGGQLLPRLTSRAGRSLLADLDAGESGQSPRGDQAPAPSGASTRRSRIPLPSWARPTGQEKLVQHSDRVTIGTSPSGAVSAHKGRQSSADDLPHKETSQTL